MNKYIKLSLMAGIFAAFGLIYSCNIPDLEDREQMREDESVVIETVSQAFTEESGMIYVYICGEVVSAGVYEMEAGSRLYQLVELAGGFTDRAAAESLNLAEELYDTQKVIVLSVDDAADAAVTQTSYDDGLVNINTSDINKLMSLPGIGEVKAQDIVSYRDKNGSFLVPEDIMKVPGIKESLYNKIKDLITVG